jgi:hypothetical protein
MAHDDDLSHAALTEMAKQFDDAEGNVTDIEKGGGGAHDLAGALVRHLKDRLESKREAHGFEKKEQPMNRIATLRGIAKAGGILAIAKVMVAEDRSYGITEEEFVQFATEDAVKKFPGETADRAFTRMFTDGGADGLTLRRAHAVVKASHAEQMFGPTFPAAAKADRSEGKAYNELLAKAAELRKTHPELSEAQAFAAVYSDRSNIDLAKRERAESAPR